MTSVKVWIFVAVSMALGTLSCRAEEFILGTHPQADPFFLDVLNEALKAADGNHSLRTYEVKYNQARTLLDLEAGQAAYNIYFTGHDKAREESLLQIDIPLTKGLLGTRVLFVHPNSAQKIDRVTSFNELKKFRFISGITWPDTEILRHNGLKVLTAPKDNQLLMLIRNRVDIYPRGAMEWVKEWKEWKPYFNRKQVRLNTHIVLKYRADLFFYLSKSDIRRAAILRQGLERIMKNGVYERMFNGSQHMREALEAIMKHNPLVFELENPLVSERVKNIPEEYWYQFREKP